MALTAAEQAEMAQLEKEVGGGSSGLSKEEQAELKALEGEVGHLDQENAPRGTNEGGGLLDKAARVLDYPGGLVRTAGAGLGNLYSLATGSKPVATGDDVMAALKGKAPSSAQYLERAGLSEGPSMEVPMLGKVSARDAEGLALDVASDPLTLIGKGAKALGRYSGLINPAGELMEAGGKSVYKSGLKKVDERLLEKGNKPISDILMNEGKWGTTKKLAKDANKIGKEAFDSRSQLYNKADELGVKIDLTRSLKGAEEQLSKIKADPGLAPTAEKLEGLINRYKEAGPIDLKTASEWKTNLYNALPETAFDSHGKLKGPAAKFQKAIARDFKTSIEEAGNFAEKGLGDEVSRLNEIGGSVLASKRPMAMQVRRGETPNLVSSVDAMIGGVGFLDPTAAAGIYGAKKLGDLSKTTLARTGSGLLMQKAGKSGIPDALLRRGLINEER